LQFSDRQLHISDRILWVLEISVLPLNPQMADFELQILYFWSKIFRQSKMYGRGANAPTPVTMPLYTVNLYSA